MAVSLPSCHLTWRQPAGGGAGTASVVAPDPAGKTTDLRQTCTVSSASVLAGAGVTGREAEVLALLGEHLSHAEIAGRLFISIRTVESHVASLRRKLGAGTHRELVRLAAGYLAAGSGAGVPAPARLPSPLTSFIGRDGEKAALAAALEVSRLVSAVGPGGTGKTRLALAVAAAEGRQFADGTWYVDLVPVAD